jgi:predicted nucleic acid-binding protein
MNSTACVDASIVIKLVVEEPGSDLADALWAQWIQQDVQIVAPALLRYEITAVLGKKVYRGQLSKEIANMALTAALDLKGIEYIDSPVLHLRALELASQFGLPTAYDAHYLALAEQQNCEFWTADVRLTQRISQALPYLRQLE